MTHSPFAAPSPTPHSPAGSAIAPPQSSPRPSHDRGPIPG